MHYSFCQGFLAIFKWIAINSRSPAVTTTLLEWSFLHGPQGSYHHHKQNYTAVKCLHWEIVNLLVECSMMLIYSFYCESVCNTHWGQVKSFSTHCVVFHFTNTSTVFLFTVHTSIATSLQKRKKTKAIQKKYIIIWHCNSVCPVLKAKTIACNLPYWLVTVWRGLGS